MKTTTAIALELLRTSSAGLNLHSRRGGVQEVLRNHRLQEAVRRALGNKHLPFAQDAGSISHAMTGACTRAHTEDNDTRMRVRVLQCRCAQCARVCAYVRVSECATQSCTRRVADHRQLHARCACMCVCVRKCVCVCMGMRLNVSACTNIPSRYLPAIFFRCPPVV